MKKLRIISVILFALLLGILPGRSIRVYFDNSSKKWSTPKCYTWVSTSTSTNNSWPGKDMTKLSGTLYYYDLPSGHNMCIFNSGAGGDSNQTTDLSASDLNVYYADDSYSGSKLTGHNKGSIVPSALYIQGTVNGNSWASDQGVAMTKSGNTFTAVATVNASGTGTTGSFGFSSKIGADWNTNVNTGNRFGSAADNTTITAGTPTTLQFYGSFSNGTSHAGNCKSWAATEGTYLFTVNFNNMTVTILPFEISLSKSVISVGRGESTTLTATVSPEGAGTVTWSSSDTSVATVSNGTVTGVSNGEAVITATSNGVSATCSVYVGKSSQTITWDQSLPSLGVGQEATLSATASSGLAVTFTVTAGSTYAHISGGKLIADAPGVVTVEASQSGNSSYAPAESVSKTVTIWLGYLMGNVTGSGAISTDDVTTTVDNILGRGTTPYNAAAADMNGDGKVNVVDVTHIVRELKK